MNDKCAAGTGRFLGAASEAIASRSVSLLRRVGIEPEVTFTGGVSNNQAMVELISELVGMPVNVSSETHHCGALGAALFALDQVLTGAIPERQTV